MDKFQAHILLVDDDEGIRSLVKKYLNENNFLVTTADSAENASEKVKIIKFDLIILDIMMSGKSGLDFINDHKKDLDTPIILLTAKGEASERVEGLELGADDYVIKPFSPKELEARIRSVLRRTEKIQLSSNNHKSGIVQSSFLKIDFNRRQVYKADERIKLTGMEFSLLELLVSRSGQAFSRAEILQEVWGYTPERHVDTRVVDVHISRLRAKLEIDPSNPDLILTARGTGYLFQRIVVPNAAT